MIYWLLILGGIITLLLILLHHLHKRRREKERQRRLLYQMEKRRKIGERHQEILNQIRIERSEPEVSQDLIVLSDTAPEKSIEPVYALIEELPLEELETFSCDICGADIIAGEEFCPVCENPIDYMEEEIDEELLSINEFDEELSSLIDYLESVKESLHSIELFSDSTLELPIELSEDAGIIIETRDYMSVPQEEVPVFEISTEVLSEMGYTKSFIHGREIFVKNLYFKKNKFFGEIKLFVDIDENIFGILEPPTVLREEGKHDLCFLEIPIDEYDVPAYRIHFLGHPSSYTDSSCLMNFPALQATLLGYLEETFKVKQGGGLAS